VCDRQPATFPTPPAGAVVVDPAVVGDVADKTDALPAGTTFWFKPGTHTLGNGEFDQVIPKDGDTYLGAPGAVLDGKGKNSYAFTQHARNVTIRNLTVQGFVAPQDQGVVNHDSGDGWVIENNTFQNNKGAAVMAGSHQRLRFNCLRNNGQYAMNAYQAGDKIVGLVVENNEISGNNSDDTEAGNPGCGCSGGIKFWSVNGADIRNNWIHDNKGAALWADTNNNDFLIENNLIENNDGEAVFYEISYNLIMRGNTLRGNAIAEGKDFASREDTFPVGAVYLSEAGGDASVPARTTKIEIYDNLFDNNWSGITAWENADRFCNSAGNTSTGYCTKRVSQTSKCSQPGIASAPLFSDCRWKTQNVDIHDNTFRFDPAKVGCTNGLCGRMAVLSNFGTFPANSPYKGTVVQDAITFKQGNTWHGNSYTGPWTFMPFDTGHVLTTAQWQAAPYEQDACSSFTGGAKTC
jgi:Right handed beta helix region